MKTVFFNLCWQNNIDTLLPYTPFIRNHFLAVIINIQKKYDSQTKPYYAASRLWVDAIIDPKDTRKWISFGIEAANNNPAKEEYKTGVIQT